MANKFEDAMANLAVKNALEKEGKQRRIAAMREGLDKLLRENRCKLVISSSGVIEPGGALLQGRINLGFAPEEDFHQEEPGNGGG